MFLRHATAPFMQNSSCVVCYIHSLTGNPIELSIKHQQPHLTVPTNLLFLSNEPTLRGFS